MGGYVCTAYVGLVAVLVRHDLDSNDSVRNYTDNTMTPQTTLKTDEEVRKEFLSTIQVFSDTRGMLSDSAKNWIADFFLSQRQKDNEVLTAAVDGIETYTEEGHTPYCQVSAARVKYAVLKLLTKED